MSTQTTVPIIPAQRDRASKGSRKRLAAGANEHRPSSLGTKLTMLFVCALWIVPTLGVLVTSFRDVDAASSSGWWTIFAHPSELTHLTLGNYGKAIDSAHLGTAFMNSLAIALPATSCRSWWPRSRRTRSRSWTSPGGTSCSSPS